MKKFFVILGLLTIVAIGCQQPPPADPEPVEPPEGSLTLALGHGSGGGSLGTMLSHLHHKAVVLHQKKVALRNARICNRRARWSTIHHSTVGCGSAGVIIESPPVEPEPVEPVPEAPEEET